jgi:phosphatidylglycerophosphate synthase
VQKIENSPLDPLVKWLFPKLLPLVPAGLSANAISIIGIISAMLVSVCLYLTAWSRWMCILGAVLVFVHWFADTLDGVVARARQTTKLGFYLDHFGDSLSVVFIGLGMFLIAGSHFTIGLVVIILYLLLIINGLIKAELTRVMELPTFGPTELHILAIALLVAQPFIDFGQPLSWYPYATGDQGWLTRSLGFDQGLTLIDVAGLGIIIVAALMLIIEIIRAVNAITRLDRG